MLQSTEQPINTYR